MPHTSCATQSPDRADGCSKEQWAYGQHTGHLSVPDRADPGYHKGMGTWGGSSCAMQIAFVTVRQQQQNTPSAQKLKEISRSQRSSTQKLLHSLQYKEGMGLLEQVQLRDTEMKGLEHLLCEDRLRELGPFMSQRSPHRGRTWQ